MPEQSVEWENIAGLHDAVLWVDTRCLDRRIFTEFTNQLRDLVRAYSKQKIQVTVIRSSNLPGEVTDDKFGGLKILRIELRIDPNSVEPVAWRQWAFGMSKGETDGHILHSVLMTEEQAKSLQYSVDMTKLN
jgi:hypothetical protein